MRPAPRASQTDDESAGAGEEHTEQRQPAAKKKRVALTGGEWAAAHGDAWQAFLQEKLKKCECTIPTVSHSKRAKALKEDDGDGIAPGEPAACLMCFAPIEKEVRRSLCRGWSSPPWHAMSSRGCAMSPRPKPRTRRRLVCWTGWLMARAERR